MAGTLIKTLRVRLEADASKLVKEMDAASKSVENIGEIGKRMKGFGQNISTYVTLPLAAIGAASFKMAVDAEESANKFNVVMGGAADQTRAALERLTETIPMTRQEMEAMAAGVQDMLVPMGVAREQAAGMSVDMVELAGDLASFNNVGTDEVLMAIQSALAGSSEPMRRFGVDTRVTRLQALALKEGLIEQGEALDNTSTALAVLMAIQEDSTDAMGDAARTVDSTANQVRFLWREIKDLGITIGEILIPVVTPLIGYLKDLVAWFGDLSPTTQKVIVVTAGLAAALGPVLVALGGLLALAPQLVAGIKLVGLAFGSPLIGPIGIAVAAIGSIVLAGVEVIKHWDVLKYEAGRLTDNVVGFFRGMASDIKNAVSGMIERVQEFFVGGFTRIVDGIRQQIDRVTGFFTGLADRLVGHSIIPDMVDGIGSNFNRMAGLMVGYTEEGVAGVTAGFDGLDADLSAASANAVDGVLYHFDRMDDSILFHTSNTLGTVSNLFDDFGIELPGRIKNLVDEVASRWGHIKDVIELPAKDALFKSLTDWKDFAVGVISAIKSIWNKVGKYITEINKAFNAGVNPFGMGGIPGGGGGVTIVPGAGGVGGGLMTYEWATVEAFWRNTNHYLEEIRDNTAVLNQTTTAGNMSVSVTVNNSGAVGGEDLGREIGEGLIDAVNTGLGSLVYRDNRRAGYVETT